MSREVIREKYLNELMVSRGNGLIKIIAGIRRCGKSYLLRTIFKRQLISEGVLEDHIIEMSFDLYDNIEYRNPQVFYPWALSKLVDNDTYYFLLDEVQYLEDFVSVLNGLADKKNCDVYVTGSNAKFLSSDIVTEFGGRGDLISMNPLSFAEFCSAHEGSQLEAWNDYITYGGIPMIVLAASEEKKAAMLENLLQETYLSDIIFRHKVQNEKELGELLNILASCIGTLTNPNKLQNTFATVNKSKITATTITEYLRYMEDAFLISEAQRYDLRGRSYIGTPLKYYFTDLGLRNSRLEFRQMEVTHIMENVIYNELRIRGYKVDIGNLTIEEKSPEGKRQKKQIEIDFVCRKNSKCFYLQSCYMMEDEAKQEQELRPFRKLKDSFPKVVVTMNTPKPFYTEEGFLVMNVFDFLLKPELTEF